MWYQVEHEFSLIFFYFRYYPLWCWEYMLLWVDILGWLHVKSMFICPLAQRKWKRVIQGVLELKQRMGAMAIKVGHFLVCQYGMNWGHSSLVISSNTGKICAFVNLGFVLFVVFFFLLLLDMHTELMFAILHKALWVNLSDPMQGNVCSDFAWSYSLDLGGGTD